MSQVLSDRTGGSGHKLKHKRFSLKTRKQLFTYLPKKRNLGILVHGMSQKCALAAIRASGTMGCITLLLSWLASHRKGGPALLCAGVVSPQC